MHSVPNHTPTLSGQSRRWSLVLMAPVLLAVYLPLHVVFAADRKWDGSSSALWATKQNWSNNSVPIATDSATFDASNTSVFTIDVGGARTILGLTFSSAAGTDAFTFNNSTLTINDSGIVNSDAETQTFNGTVIADVTQTWNAASGGLAFSAINLSSAITLTLSGAGTMAASGMTTFANDVTLDGTNGFAFNGTFVNSGASRTLTNNSTGAITLAAVNLSESATARTLTMAGSGNTSITGVIANGGSGAGGVIKTGTGTLTLSGNSTFTGTTTLSAGTLRATTSANALGTGAATLALAGGTLQLANDSNLNFARNTTVTAPTTITSDRLTAGAGSTHTLGTLSLGAQTLTIDAGANVTSGTAGVTFGATTLTGNSLFSVGAGAQATLGALNGGGVARTLTKEGEGTLIFAAAPGAAVTSGSSLVITGGIARVTATEALTSGTSYDVTINATAASGTAAFELNNVNQTVGSLTFGGASAGASAVNSVITGTGTLTLAGNVIYSATNNPGTATLGGNLAVGGSNRTFTIDDSSNATIDLAVSAAISGTGGIVKSGAGTLQLSGANSFTGKTSIEAGTVSISSISNVGGGSSSLGAPATVANGTIDLGSGTGTGTLLFTGAMLQSTDRVINLAGSSGGGTIESSGAGALSFTSDLTATAAGAKTLTLTGTSTGNAFGGALVNGAGTTSLLKDGTGTWTLNGSTSNTYTGPTTVNAGTLVLAKSDGATAVAGSILLGDGAGTDTVQLNASQQIANTSTVTFTAGGTPTLNLNGNSQALASIATTNPGAQIQFGSPAGASTLAVGDGSNTTYAGVFTSGNASANLVKQGSGTLTLSGASSGYTGAVAVNEGTLVVQHGDALGAGTIGTTVAANAILQLDGGIAAQNGGLTLTSNAMLAGSNGNNRWAGNITLSGNATIRNDYAAGQLDLGNDNTAYSRATFDPTGTPVDANTLSLGGNTVTFGGVGTVFANTRITGTGNVVVNMTNPDDVTWFTANMNTYSGTTSIYNGTLGLATLYNTFPNDPAHPNFFGINGAVTIGDGSGAANTARLVTLSGSLFDELINFNSTITLNRDGNYNLLAAQSISGLTFNGGNVDLGTTGSLYLNGDVTVNASAGNTATIGGTGSSSLSLTIHNGDASATNRVFNLVGGAGNTSDLTISARITSGSLTKTGAGTLTITGDNSVGYAGTTTVNNGFLNIQHGNALGQADGTAGTGTTVAAGGTLQVQGGISVGSERLTLDGTGANGNGALQNVAGTNSWGGAVIVNDARVQSDTGLLTLNGTVTVNTALDIRGAGDTTLSGAIGGSGALAKNGAGTLVISGDNTFGGTTAINDGVLRLTHGNALGSAAAGTTVAVTGAALELTGGITTAAEPLALNGTGVSGNGALRSVSGANTFAGPVTLQSATTLTANTGASLTLSGGLATSLNALTIGTAANNGSITISGDITGGGGLIKNGTGSLTFSGGSGTLGAVQLNAGTISIGSGSTLNTGGFASAAGTTLTIASGGTVVADYAAGSTTFSGALAGSGTFQKTGDGTLAFNNSFDASGLTLKLSGGTLSLNGQFSFGTIEITGNTILDFNNSAGTFLTSANLIIGAGVTVTVNNWVSLAGAAGSSTIWYVTNTLNGGTLGGTNQAGGTPLNQIGFSNYNGLTTTWVSGTGDGWFNQEIRPTPEPATYGAIFLGGCFGLLGWRRFATRRRRD